MVYYKLIGRLCAKVIVSDVILEFMNCEASVYDFHREKLNGSNFSKESILNPPLLQARIQILAATLWNVACRRDLIEMLPFAIFIV